eukprot:scaffold82167_cov41-Phaeocystis_antarctica.AAC.1
MRLYGAGAQRLPVSLSDTLQLPYRPLRRKTDSLEYSLAFSHNSDSYCTLFSYSSRTLRYRCTSTYTNAEVGSLKRGRPRAYFDAAPW